MLATSLPCTSNDSCACIDPRAQFEVPTAGRCSREAAEQSASSAHNHSGRARVRCAYALPERSVCRRVSSLSDSHLASSVPLAGLWRLLVGPPAAAEWRRPLLACMRCGRPSIVVRSSIRRCSMRVCSARSLTRPFDDRPQLRRQSRRLHRDHSMGVHTLQVPQRQRARATYSPSLLRRLMPATPRRPHWSWASR